MSRYAAIRAGRARRADGQPSATPAPRHRPAPTPAQPVKSKHFDGWVGHPYGRDGMAISNKRAKAKIGRDTARRQRILAAR